MMLFDTHAHLNDEAFNRDREDLLAGLPEKGIGLVMNIVKNRNLTTISALHTNSPYAPQTGTMRKWAR